MSVSQELQNIRIGLEEESRSLNEERQKLEEKLKTLRDKVAIEELRRSNQATRDAVSQLKTEINELEQRLNNPTAAPQPCQQPQGNITESIATLNPEAPAMEQQVDDKKPEEKRRRFF